MAVEEIDRVWGRVLSVEYRPIYGSGRPYHVCRIDFGRNGKSEVVAEEIENCAQGWHNPQEKRGFVWRH
jgi:hypothetical protein